MINLKKLIKAASCLLMAPCLSFCAVACHKEQLIADVVLYGKIHTMDANNSVAEAVAIRNGRIIAVGSKKDINQYIGFWTRQMHYDKAGTNYHVFPGFIESHAHGEELGCYATIECPLTNTMSYEQCREAMRSFIQSQSRMGVLKTLYIGNGWQYQTQDGKVVEPTADDLALGSPYDEHGIQLMLLSEELHKVWVNRNFLEARMDYAYQLLDKYGPDLVKVNERGEPTGVFCDNAMIAMCTPLPTTMNEIKQAVKWWQDFALSQGYTSANEGSIFWEGPWAGTPKIYHDLDVNHELKLRTFASMYLLEQVCDKPMDLVEYEREAIKTTALNTQNFTVAAVKIFLDGVIEARTGLLNDKYDDSTEDDPYYGISRYDKFGDHETQIKLLSLLTTIANKRGLSAHFHAIGDRAVHIAAEACARSQEETLMFYPGNTILHCQLVDEESKQLMAKHHIYGALSPLWFPVAPAYKALELQYLGEGREYYQAYPLKSLWNKGVHTTFCSDIPAGSISMNISRALYKAIERKEPTDESGEYRRGDKNRTDWEGVDGTPGSADRIQLVRCFTTEPAKMLQASDWIGSVEAGKFADFSIFDVDWINCEVEEMPDPAEGSHVVATIVNGVEQYVKQ